MPKFKETAIKQLIWPIIVTFPSIVNMYKHFLNQIESFHLRTCAKHLGCRGNSCVRDRKTYRLSPERFVLMDRRYPHPKNLPEKIKETRLLFSPCSNCGEENSGRKPPMPQAGICCQLSAAVRGNSDWWKIRKTDCMVWWTAVSPRNLAICHPAELTIASTPRLLFQSRAVILPVSRLLVRCQLRAEASIAQPCRWRCVWNDMSFSSPNIETN